MNTIDHFAMNNTGELIEGYLAMARDAAREREAEEWAEGLIGDSFAVAPVPLRQRPASRRALHFESARSSENAPAPRNNSAAAIASTSR